MKIYAPRPAVTLYAIPLSRSRLDIADRKRYQRIYQLATDYPTVRGNTSVDELTADVRVVQRPYNNGGGFPYLRMSSLVTAVANDIDPIPEALVRKDQPGVIRFLELPAELRNYIYAMCLIPTRVKVGRLHNNIQHAALRVAMEQCPLVGLIFTSRQLYADLSGMIRGVFFQHEFDISISWDGKIGLGNVMNGLGTAMNPYIDHIDAYRIVGSAL